MDDSKIVELYLERNESAISFTSEKYGKRLKRIAMNVLADEGVSEECENDTYLKTWNLIPPNEPRDYLFAFCGKIIRHLAIDKLRYENGQKRSARYCELTDEILECIPGDGDVFSQISRSELVEIINGYLDKCTDEQRNIFVRRYYYFDSVADISRRYGITPSKIKTTLFRMREKLKLQLEIGGYSV